MKKIFIIILLCILFLNCEKTKKIEASKPKKIKFYNIELLYPDEYNNNNSPIYASIVCINDYVFVWTERGGFTQFFIWTDWFDEAMPMKCSQWKK